MKRLLILTVLVILPVLACSQTRFESPQTIAWDGESTLHEVAIQMAGEELISLGETSNLEYYIDLQALEIYGSFTIMVRAVQFTTPDMFDYTEWLRSDNPDHVIMIDGVPQLFKIDSKEPAKMPTMIWIK